MKIVIDPGHGGKDPGAVGPTGLHESAVAYIVARRLKVMLDKNHEAHLTRGSDSEEIQDHRGPVVTLKRRSATANDLGADLFISIHCNAAQDRAASGFEILYGNSKSEAFADLVYDAMKARLGGSHNPRGVKLTGSSAYRQQLYVLNNTNAPAILVELEFISNPEQEQIFLKPSSLDYYARTLAIGIEAYAKALKDRDSEGPARSLLREFVEDPEMLNPSDSGAMVLTAKGRAWMRRAEEELSNWSVES